MSSPRNTGRLIPPGAIKQEGINNAQAAADYQFTETFYGQLVTNLDDIFEEFFFAPLEQVSQIEASGNPQINYDDSGLRTLFADIAALYAEPVKAFIKKLKQGELQKLAIDNVKYSLQDIVRAGLALGLNDLCDKISQLINEIEQLRLDTDDAIKKERVSAVLLRYDDLIELLPQTFSFEGYQRSNIKIIPAPASMSGPRMTVSMAALSSNLEIYYYPPRLHKDIEIIEHEENEQPIFWIKDSRSSRYFKAKKREHDIIMMLDGSKTLRQICQAVQSSMKITIKPHQLVKLIAKLDSLGLIDGKQAASSTQSGNKKEVKIYKVGNPDKILTDLDRRLSWIYTKTFVFSSLFVMLLIYGELYRRYNEFIAQGNRIINIYGYLSFIVTVLIVVALHEFGHGLTCKHFGGRVSNMGFTFIAYVLPAGYCDVSDSYLFKNKLHRVYVLVAGVYTQFLLGAVNILGWLLFAPNSWMSDISLLFFSAALISVTFNFLPLLKLDGYYILTNLLNEQNLQKRATLYTQKFMRWLIFGEVNTITNLTQFQKWFYLTYRFTYLIFIVVFSYSICLSFYDWAVTGYGKIGIILSLLFSYLSFKTIIRGIIKFPHTCLLLIRDSRQQMLVRVRAGFVFSLLVTGLLFLLLGSWTERIWSSCVLTELPTNTHVVKAKNSGIVSELFVHDRDVVAVGQPLAKLVNYDDDLEMHRLTNEIDELDRQTQVIKSQIDEQQSILSQYSKQAEFYQQLAEDKSAEVEALATTTRQDENYPARIRGLERELVKWQTRAQYQQEIITRNEKLLAAELITPPQLEQMRVNLQTTREQLESTRARLAKEVTEYHRISQQLLSQHQQADGQVNAETEILAQQQARLAVINIALKDKKAELELIKQRRQYEVVADYKGIIYYPELTQLANRPVQAGEQLCKIADLSKLKAELEVSEWDITSLKPGQTVELSVRTLDGKFFLGKVMGINPELIIKNNGHYYTAYLTIENPEGLLKPGMTGVSVVRTGKRPIRESGWRILKRIIDYPNWLW